jgi:hypothetical protein
MRITSSETPAPSVSAERSVTLHGAALALARCGWALLAALVIGLDIAGIPATYAQMTTVYQPGGATFTGILTAAQAHALSASGFSLSQYAALQVISNGLTELVFFLVAGALFWRRPANRIALFASFALIVFGGTFGDAPSRGMMGALALLSPSWGLVVQAIGFLGDVSFPVLFYLFPSGQWVPRWTRWLVIPWLIYEGLQDFVPGNPLNQNSLLGTLLFVGLVITTVIAQVYRYRRISTPIERQQTKWVVFGFAIGIGGFLSTTTLGAVLVPDMTTWSPLAILLTNAGINLFMTLIPLSIGVAILRSRLFDIDIIINRALVYGALTATLAAVYFGSVVGLQQMVRLLNGQQTQQAWVIVLSTLMIAALFQPLRRRLQSAIDRRFYRSRYDAARTLERFAASLRSEVDLRQLTDHLVSAVDETMRPSQVSLWLQPQRTRRGDGGHTGM